MSRVVKNLSLELSTRSDTNGHVNLILRSEQNRCDQNVQFSNDTAHFRENFNI